MSASIAADVRSFVVANYLLGRRDGFDDNASFMDQGIIDSTGILELVSHLEETYGIEISDDELTPDNLDSVSRITSYLAHKLNGGSKTTVPPPNPEAVSQLP
jgi:acyl carrier protein